MMAFRLLMPAWSASGSSPRRSRTTFHVSIAVNSPFIDIARFGDALIAAAKGMSWVSPRGKITIMTWLGIFPLVYIFGNFVGMILPRDTEAPAQSEDSEFQQVQSAVLRECIVNLARIKEAVTQSVGGTLDAAGMDSWQDLMRDYKMDWEFRAAENGNIALTGGVRYRIDRERMAAVKDDRRDSQAVYVGTAFKF